MKHASLVCLIAMASCGNVSNDSHRSIDISVIDVNQLRPNFFKGISPAEYERVFDQALLLQKDTSDENKIRGEIIIAFMADDLKSDIDSGKVDVSGVITKRLIAKLHNESYLVYRPKPSDWDKIVYHVREGDFQYIYRRAKSEWYFWPTGALGAITPTVVIILVWKRRKHITL